jgi:GAF domain-containing protein
MSLATPKPPRRSRGRLTRNTAIRYRIDKARQASLDGPLLIYKVAREINRAASAMEVLRAAASAIARTTHPSVVFTASPDKKNLLIPQDEGAILIPLEQIEALLPNGRNFSTIPSNATDTEEEAALRILTAGGWKKAALMPIRLDRMIAALIVVELNTDSRPSLAALRVYATIAEITEAGLDKTQAMHSAQRPLAELEAFNFISQAVSGQTDLKSLYATIHKAIAQILGQVDLMIAEFDPGSETIQVPYLYEHPELLSVDPFPLGEGLTSTLINTCQPLLLSGDVESQARDLGAKILGGIPKSWLGVPLLIAEKPIGALVVQDLENAGRFTEDDQRMLTSLGSQIAVTIYNARLIEQSRRLAERERLLHEVTSKIRSSTDMRTILATTATEIGRALNLQRATMAVGLDEAAYADKDRGQENGDGPAYPDMTPDIEELVE